MILKVLDTMVQAASPALPAIWLMVGFAAMARLRKQGISLLFADELKLGASCDTVCFDKTGTLTGATVRPIM